MSIQTSCAFCLVVRDAVCARNSPGRAAQKLVRRHNKRTQPLRVGEHRFEDCSPSSLRAARRRGRGRRGARPTRLLGASCWARRARHEHAAQHFLNRSPCTDAVADSEPPPEPWPRARADATPSPRRVATISTHARAAALRRSPRATTKRCPIRRSTRPRAAAAPRADALATIRCTSDPQFVDTDVEGTDPSFCVYPTFAAPDALDWHPSGPRAERPDAVAAVDATFNATASQRSARTRAPAGEGGRGASRRCKL